MDRFPPSYKYSFDNNGVLKAKPYHWAFAKQTRSQPSSRAPYASIILRKSAAARLLSEAKAGDTVAEQRLIQIIVNNIRRIAQAEQWIDEIEFRAEVMARAGLWDAIYSSAPLSQNKICNMLDVKNKNSYKKKWEPRILIVKSWVKSWEAQ